MNTIKFIFISVAITAVFACVQQNTEKQLNDSRFATQELAKNLKAKLVKGMQTGGPVNALKICNVEAEKIASSVSENLDLEVGRTSLKLRNPSNLTDTWEKEVLHFFEEQKQNGADIKNLERYEITKEKAGKYFRYMKAIPTSEICLVCHGESIAPDLQNKLQTLYPNDQATGYKPGDLRGAFTVKIKL